jgi:hypothetical protein
MATVSIGALRYDIIADTVGFEKGLFRTRKEMRAAEKVFRRSQSAQEQYKNSIKRVDDMLDKNAISIKAHRMEVKRLTREYTEAHTRLGRFRKMMSTKLGVLASTATAVALVTSGIRKLNQDLDTIDKLDKGAKAMGESVDRLQAIQFAASQTAGMGDDETLAAIEKMTKRISEAAQGMGEAQAALKLLNLDARMLVKLRPYEQFKLLAESMESIPDAATRAMIAQRLFDMEARRLQITMKGGAESIESYRRQAESLGLLLSPEAVEDVVKANDAIDRLTRSWEAMSLVLTSTLAPAIEYIADKLQFITDTIGALRGKGWLFNTDSDLGLRQQAMAKGAFEGFVKGGVQGAVRGIGEGYVERSFEKVKPDWVKRLEGKPDSQINAEAESKVKGWMDTFNWFGFGDGTHRKGFRLLDRDDQDKKSTLDGEGSGADPDDLGIQRLTSGTTATQNSIEEYRFLVEKQQRENQALLVEGNTRALIENTNALLNTVDTTFPERADLSPTNTATEIAY